MTVADASGKRGKERRHNNVFIKPVMSAKKNRGIICLFVFEMAFLFHLW